MEDDNIDPYPELVLKDNYTPLEYVEHHYKVLERKLIFGVLKDDTEVKRLLYVAKTLIDMDYIQPDEAEEVINKLEILALSSKLSTIKFNIMMKEAEVDTLHEDKLEVLREIHKLHEARRERDE